MVSASFHPNENLLKLRELSDKLCAYYNDDNNDVSTNDDYKEIILEISNLVENSGNTINQEKKKDDKLKCYESMCFELKNILKKIKTNLK